MGVISIPQHVIVEKIDVEAGLDETAGISNIVMLIVLLVVRSVYKNISSFRINNSKF